MSEPWEVVTEKTQSHWLELRDPDGWWTAAVRWDGCIHYYKYFNVPLHEQAGLPEDEAHEMEDYLHICDIDEEIARLQALKKVAQEHFGERWPDL